MCNDNYEVRASAPHTLSVVICPDLVNPLIPLERLLLFKDLEHLVNCNRVMLMQLGNNTNSVQVLSRSNVIQFIIIGMQAYSE